MRHRYWLSCLCVVALVSAVGLMAADKAANETPISVRSFSRNNVIGLLGVPLGTVVRISGVAHDPQSKLKVWILEIDRVNGRQLKQRVSFSVFPQYAEEIESLGKFECYAAEYGGFEGDRRNPDKFDVEDPAQTSTSHEIRYCPSLHICKLKDRRPTPAPIPTPAPQR